MTDRAGRGMIEREAMIDTLRDLYFQRKREKGVKEEKKRNNWRGRSRWADSRHDIIYGLGVK